MPQVQAAIRSAIPNATVSDPETIERYFAGMIAQRKFNMIVLALFGSLAVLIAAAGIYGLMSFLVTQRTREIGVRLALGAVPGGILHMVLTRALGLLAVGLFFGLAAAAGPARRAARVDPLVALRDS